jgi:hypothetical protein
MPVNEESSLVCFTSRMIKMPREEEMKMSTPFIHRTFWIIIASTLLIMVFTGIAASQDPIPGCYIIFGNKDGSVMPAHLGNDVDIPIWGVTPYGNNVATVVYMHIPLASNDEIIAQRLGGVFPDTLVGRWPDRSFLPATNHDGYPPNGIPPDPLIPAGFTSQSMLGFGQLGDHGDPWNFFRTDGDTVLIATFKMKVINNDSLLGDTIQPFILGHDYANGGLFWGMHDGLQVAIPTASFSPLQLLEHISCPYVPGDINGSGLLNGIDIVYGVNYFKGGNPPMVRCDMCPQSQPFYAAGDINGDCIFNGLDITYIVHYLKTSFPPVRFCPSCPPAGQ